MTLAVKLKAERIWVGERFSVSFQRKQRVDEPSAIGPGWGALPITSLHDCREKIPNIPDIHNAFLIPVGEDEAVWLGFQGASFKPNAVKIGIGDENAITCEKWDEILRSSPQNYLVCPPQLSLETMCAEEGKRSQIVPPASGSASADWNANRISLIVYEPFEGRFAGEAPNQVDRKINVLHSIELNDTCDYGKRSGEIRSDPIGIDVWDDKTTGSLQVYMANHEEYRKITGRQPPTARSSTEVYGGHLLP